MKNCKDKEFDLAIVDPPYGIQQDSFRVKSRTKLAKTTDWGDFDWDKEPPPNEYFSELFRISKNQIVFGANHFISRMPFDSSCWIVWDKDNGESHYADCELAWTSFDTAVRKAKYRWNGMLQQDMKNKEVRIHPTQKPRKLYSWIFETYAQKGQRIIDTHLGSGSSAIAAYYFGCDFVGTEIDTKKFNDMKERYDDETAQTILNFEKIL